MKIFENMDWGNLHSITWSDFCTHLQMELNILFAFEAGKSVLEFHLPAQVSDFPFRDQIISIATMPGGRWITICQVSQMTAEKFV